MLVLLTVLLMSNLSISSTGWGGHEGWFSREPLPVFSAGGPCEQFCHGQGCPLFDVHPAFPPLTTVSPTLQGVLKDSFGETGVWHARSTQVPISWHLPEEVRVDPQGSLAFFCADFHSICHCFVYERVGEVLKFTIAATHKINIVGKS